MEFFMKNLLKALTIVSMLSTLAIEARYWKCPNDDADYETRAEARAACGDAAFYSRTTTMPAEAEGREMVEKMKEKRGERAMATTGSPRY